jgi:hypothetical protein
MNKRKETVVPTIREAGFLLSIPPPPEAAILSMLGSFKNLQEADGMLCDPATLLRSLLEL